MTSHITSSCLPQLETETAAHLFDNWFDPIETKLRDRVREFLQALLEAELDEALGRSRYGRLAGARNHMIRRPRRKSPVTVTAIGRGRCWERSAGSRLTCRAPG
jgi:hypothetical protein